LIDVAPTAAYGYALLGFISYKRGALADTVRYLTKALELDGSDADALFFRGIALEAAGQGEAERLAQSETESVTLLLDLVAPVRNHAHNRMGVALLKGTKPPAQEFNELADAASPRQPRRTSIRVGRRRRGLGSSR
jgi:hypothetical protein